MIVHTEINVIVHIKIFSKIFHLLRLMVKWYFDETRLDLVYNHWSKSHYPPGNHNTSWHAGDNQCWAISTGGWQVVVTWK